MNSHHPHAMKILVLDLNFTYINKTRNALIEMFKILPNCHVYGPGYVNDGILSSGLSKYCEQHGPFSIVVATEHVTIFPFLEKNCSPKNWAKNYFFTFQKNIIYPALKEYYHFFSNFEGIKIASFLETDYYHFSLERAEELARINAYVLGWGSEFIADIEKENDLYLDNFTTKANNVWRNFLQKNPNKVISFPFFVSQNEIFKIPLEKRKIPWSITGADYHFRQQVRSILTKHHIPWRGQLLRKLHSLFGKIRFNPYNKKWSINALNFLFSYCIRSAKYAYTDGSRLRYLVRKYLEIPSQGTLLVCDECCGFSDFGFKDGINSILCKPQDILAVYEKLTNDPRAAQQIASNGQKLILEQHTVERRAQQFLKACAAIQQGIFEGSYWQNGQFCLKTSQFNRNVDEISREGSFFHA